MFDPVKSGFGLGAPYTDFFFDKAEEMRLVAVFGYSFFGLTLNMLWIRPDLDDLIDEVGFL